MNKFPGSGAIAIVRRYSKERQIAMREEAQLHAESCPWRVQLLHELQSPLRDPSGNLMICGHGPYWRLS